MFTEEAFGGQAHLTFLIGALLCGRYHTIVLTATVTGTGVTWHT